MMHDSLCTLIDCLVYDSGMTETEAISLIGRVIQEELPIWNSLLQPSCEYKDQNMNRA